MVFVAMLHGVDARFGHGGLQIFHFSLSA
jgi:hypothetical protein